LGEAQPKATSGHEPTGEGGVALYQVERCRPGMTVTGGCPPTADEGVITQANSGYRPFLTADHAGTRKDLAA
jgi:hypothetical protein